jgi:hypothetical protein
VGGALAFLASWFSTGRLLKARSQELEQDLLRRRQDRSLNSNTRLVRLMRGLLAEVQTNIEMRPWQIASPMRADYVVDVWAGAKDQLGELPDEVLDAVRAGYAMAARYNSLAAWERSWGFESQGAVVSVKGVYSDKVDEAGQEAHDAFKEAVPVLQHWLLQGSQSHRPS